VTWNCRMAHRVQLESNDWQWFAGRGRAEVMNAFYGS
jgi:hypothetical protein